MVITLRNFDAILRHWSGNGIRAVCVKFNSKPHFQLFIEKNCFSMNSEFSSSDLCTTDFFFTEGAYLNFNVS